MISRIIRGGAAVALVGLAALVPTAAHADTGTGSSTGAPAAVQEQQGYTGWAYENSPKEAKREAEKMARQRALISGFTPEQCVLLYANSYRLGPGYYGADAAIACNR
ncbi:hypothetical protein [Streptomyces yangpuensis]|uniref:hypothetical protein n=1 Tax=Streptomyces yangpuensis TaxID=1648182 RepID=UPI00381D6565